jgi:16S rRNA processing protein RimM
MKNHDQKSRVLLGQITGVHGIRGNVLIRSYTEAPEALASYGPLTDERGTRRFFLTVVRVTQKGIVARVDGIADRTGAETLRGTKLYVDRSQLPETDTSEYYHADLIGLKAVSEDGTRLGEIVSVQNFGAGDLLELKPESESATEFVPFESQWVPRVDLDAGIIIITRPEPSDAPEPDEDEEKKTDLD